jgi:5-keto 4-deoxyuronate isomerase
MRKLACVMIVLIVVFLSGCISSPEPVILSQDAKASLQGLDWVTVITADIENRGESGNIAVVAEVKRPDKPVMNQQQTVYIGKGEIKKVSFTFDTEFNDKVYYTVTALSS